MKDFLGFILWWTTNLTLRNQPSQNVCHEMKTSERKLINESSGQCVAVKIDLFYFHWTKRRSETVWASCFCKTDPINSFVVGACWTWGCQTLAPAGGEAWQRSKSYEEGQAVLVLFKHLAHNWELTSDGGLGGLLLSDLLCHCSKKSLVYKSPCCMSIFSQSLLSWRVGWVFYL